MIEPARPPEPGAVRPLVGLLRQLSDLIESLTDEQYARAPVGAVESGIGGHVRHNLDHVAALLRGLPGGAVCYDHRDRGTAVERDRAAALGEILRLERELAAFPWADVPGTVTLSALVAPDLPPVVAATSAEREVAFVAGHTVHHNALIRVMLKVIGAAAAADFGYAPSTIADRRRRTCVR
ncbi:DinB family protein [Gemmata sp.]|uniref:DinB family protein n=1 Tax=Gemmata sp. TaxID=1914242 RepID=UPI003F6EB4B1